MTQQKQDQKHEGETKKDQQLAPELSRDASVRERPILFSGEMVRAILGGRKTQTRRVLAVQPLEILLPADRRAKSVARVTRKWDGKRVWFALTHRGETRDRNRGTALRCKYGEVGDRLWVRETWMLKNWTDAELVEHGFPAAAPTHPAKAYLGRPTRAIHRADTDLSPYDLFSRWCSPIHMPRWASRLTLEITGIRVERVQDITPDDCEAEGIHDLATFSYDARRTKYGMLWDSLNAKRGYSWDSNPWVFVIEFCRLPVSERREGTNG